MIVGWRMYMRIGGHGRLVSERAEEFETIISGARIS